MVGHRADRRQRRARRHRTAGRHLRRGRPHRSRAGSPRPAPRCRGRRGSCRAAARVSALTLASGTSTRNFSQNGTMHVGAEHAIDTRPPRTDRAAARRARLVTPSSSPKVDLEIGAGLAHDAGRDDRAGDEGRAAHHRLAPENRDQPFVRIDAVLHRHDRGIRPDNRPKLRAGGLDIPQFDAEQHVIDRPDARDIVGRPGRADQRLAAVALDAQPVRPHRREVRAARDKRDLAPRSAPAPRRRSRRCRRRR